jgi:hypothetical protein
LQTRAKVRKVEKRYGDLDTQSHGVPVAGASAKLADVSRGILVILLEGSPPREEPYIFGGEYLGDILETEEYSAPAPSLFI